MKRFVCSKHETLAWLEYEEAQPTGSQVQVRNDFGAEKHGTMMQFFKGQGNKRGSWDDAAGVFRPGEGIVWNYPIDLGNMAVGHVAATGPEVRQLKKGDRVLCYSSFRPTIIVNESDCWAIDEQISWKTAVCLDPASYALTALRDGNVRIGDGVAVFSLGAIGLMCVQLAKLAGAHPIVAFDLSARRRDLALRLGATSAYDPREVDAGLAIREATNGIGADVVVEYSGAMTAMQGALRGVAFGGTVVAGAFPPPWPAGLDLGAEAHMNRPNIVFSRTESDPNRDHPRWNIKLTRETVIHLIRNGLIDGSEIVDPVIPFDDLMERYVPLVTDHDASIKLGVVF
ncbi:MAG: zinc-binding alcohol dehydrogenase [Lentisphaerae bacterium]|nr:zinc-binding alcohol dehydrogenase [Lentisphaerota bacterium]